MRITLLTVGRTDVPWVREGLGTYVQRIRRYLPFELAEIPEPKNASSLSRELVKAREGELVLKALKPSDVVILLDEKGAVMESVRFASYLEGFMARGVKNLVFVVGGAYGFSPGVYSRADGKLSLSAMTFPHQLVRTIFAEQVYRALTILKGEPYHHE